MSQRKTNIDNNKNSKYYFPHNQQNCKRYRGSNFRPYRSQFGGFQYYMNKYAFKPPWWPHNLSWKKPIQNVKKEPERPPSPFSGTEEYTLKKIQETSDMIKRKLMGIPEPEESPQQTQIVTDNSNGKSGGGSVDSTKNGVSENEKGSSRTSNNKKNSYNYNVEEIHDKIISHITNLSHGKKMNLICANTSGYDIAIQQIQKQKRLELSKVLRDMCSSDQALENSEEAINAIIPDIGIKIENLPLEVIQQLSSTLDLNFENGTFTEISDETVNVNNGVIDISNDSSISPIKQEKDIKSEMVPEEMIDYSLENFDQKNPQSLTQVLANFKCKPPESEVPPIQDLPVPIANIKKEIFKEEEPVDEKSKETVSVEVQTDLDFDFKSTQTEPDSSQFVVREHFDNFDDAVQEMTRIDSEIDRLNKLRQSILINLQNKKFKCCQKKKTKRSKTIKSVVTQTLQSKIVKRKANNPQKEKKSVKKVKISKKSVEKHDLYESPLVFQSVLEKISVLKTVDDIILAGSESGSLYYYDLTKGTISTAIKVSNSPITCLIIHSKKKKRVNVGTTEPRIREYTLHQQKLCHVTEIGDSVQCMEISWGCIFIGTANGSLMRCSSKQRNVDFEEKISSDSVLVLRATVEGARRVLLVGSRNAPICVRDAMSGLHLRTMSNSFTPTVYSLLLEGSMVYCGTTFHDILVFRFQDGTLIHKHQATNSKGICCMKVVENLLFASCYNGNIYVYNIKSHEYVGAIEGGAGAILSMEVSKNIVIIGTMSQSLKSVLIPEYILKHNKV